MVDLARPLYISVDQWREEHVGIVKAFAQALDARTAEREQIDADYAGYLRRTISELTARIAQMEQEITELNVVVMSLARLGLVDPGPGIDAIQRQIALTESLTAQLAEERRKVWEAAANRASVQGALNLAADFRKNALAER